MAIAYGVSRAEGVRPGRRDLGRHRQAKLDDCSAWLTQMAVIDAVNIIQSAVYRWRAEASLDSGAGIRPGPWRAKGDDP